MASRDEAILIVGGGLAGLDHRAALGPRRPACAHFRTGGGIRRHRLRHSARSQRVADVRPAGRHRRGSSRTATCREACLHARRLYGRRDHARRYGPSLSARFKHPYIIIHRVDLHQVLMDACRRSRHIAFEPAAAVTGFDDLGDRVVVQVEDGRRIEGAALIGGRRSALDHPRRNCVRKANRIKSAMWRSARWCRWRRCRTRCRGENVYLWAGPGFHMVHYPLRHGTLFNIVAVYRTETYAATTRPWPIIRCRGRAHLSPAPIPPCRRCCAMMNLERRWPLADRDADAALGDRGRVTMVGDAAHPALQSFAQGACMAIEDGVCIAALIDLADGDFTRAFAQYEAERYRAHRALAARIALDVGRLSRRGHRPRRGARILSPSAPRTTCFVASPGSMTVSAVR